MKSDISPPHSLATPTRAHSVLQWLFLAFFALLISNVHAQAPARVYEFNGSFADTMGGSPMVSGGGSLGATSYSFAAGQGPNVSNALANTGEYSIEMLFSFSDSLNTAPLYKAILNFGNVAIDPALYVNSGKIALYNYGASTTTDMVTGQMHRVVMTRNASSKICVVYVDGVQRLSVTDTGNVYVASGPGGILHFFRDNLSENSAGVVDQIRIYNQVLTPSQVSTLGATAPGSPTIGTATRGNASATVTFSAPASNGGSAITGYTATSTPGGFTGTGTSSPITVNGLTNGTAYTFTVNATNAVGTGLASAASNSVTPATVPGAPTIGTATRGNASAAVTFTAPASNGGSAITGYTATSTPGGFTGTGTSSPITVNGLTNGTAYTFTVRATNAVGSGAASAASISVTPLAPPTISSISPNTGPISGGTSVTITGTGFTGVTSVTMAGLPVTNMTVVSATSITCTTPASPLGSAGVYVNTPSGSNTSNSIFTYIDPNVTATFTSATVIPVTAAGYSATGRTVNISLGFAPAVGTTLTVVKNTSLPFIIGTFANLTQGQAVPLTFGGVTYNFVANYFGGSGNDLVLQWAGTRAMAWGYNYYGQLGNNTTTNSRIPANVLSTGVLSGKTVVAVSAGTNHTLALCSDGTLAAWGYNGQGQLGNNSTTQSNVPVAVTTSGLLSGKTVIAISAGVLHSMALCSDGTLATWGHNAFGELGNNSTTHSSVPVAVTSLGSALSGKSVIAISAGVYFSTVLCSDGTVAAWGTNNEGQLGNNSMTNSLIPVAVTTSGLLSGKTVIAISAGYSHTLSLCSDGTLATWGWNNNGQLGINSITRSTVPVAVTTSGVLSGKTVIAVAAGGFNSLVLCSDGTLAAWGKNSEGQLGNNSTANSLVPVAVTSSGTALSGKSVIALAVGVGHSLALCSDGTLAAWGDNSNGQLGDNTITNRLVPVVVNTSSLGGGNRFISIASGPQAGNSLALVASPLIPQPTIVSITPNVGSIIGGTSVTLTGTNFTGATSVTIGGANATSLIVVNATTITATTPVGTVGAKSVLVTTPGGTNDANTLFSYQPIIPTISTPTSASILATSATLGGNVTGDGGATITERGVVYAVTTTNANPLISGSGVTKVAATGTTGVFTANVSSLTAARGYSFKAYAINSQGTSYTSVGTFTTLATVPGAPTIGTATGGDASASVAFTAPASNGGSAITSYTVTSSPSGITGSGTTSPITVSGLTNGTAYTFTVTASNVVGTGTASEVSNSVMPATVPGAPTIGTATRGDTSASVAFTAPASNGGSAITSYTVTSSPSGVTATSSASPITVTGLTNGSAYTFTVTATNSAGTGSASAASNSVTPATVPGAPTIGTATRGNASASVTFTAPASDGGSAITSYTATSSPGGITGTGTVPPITVSGLANGTAYTFTVTATNAVGTSSPSAASNSVTPFPPPTIANLIPNTGSIDGGTAVTITGADFTGATSVTIGGVAATNVVVTNNTTITCTTPAGTLGAASVLVTTPSGTNAANTLYTYTRPEIAVTGNGVDIANGDASPVLADHTDFGSTAAAGGMVERTFTIMNSGVSMLTLGSVTVSGAHAADFSVTSQPAASVAAAGTITFKVTFDPSSTGLRTATLSFSNDDTDENPFNFSISGTGLTGSIRIFAWGDNRHGQLGDGTTTNRYVPVAVNMGGVLTGKTITKVVAGDGHTIALTTEGKLYTWGNNSNGQLGDGTTTNRAAPVAVDVSGALAGKTVTTVSAGFNYTVAVTSDGKLYAWGVNESGQLGDGTTTSRSVPVAVIMNGALQGKAVSEVSCSSRTHTVALTTDGKVYAWGNNYNGQLGDGTTNLRTSPVAVSMSGALLGKTVTGISAGGTHTAVVTADGKLYTWGSDGQGGWPTSPVAVDMTGVLAGKTVTAVSAGFYTNTLALTNDGELYAWGSKGFGQLGDGTNTDRPTPVAVDMTGALLGKTATAISGHPIHSTALTSEGKVYAWGWNGYGNIGDGDYSGRISPVAVNTSGVLAGAIVHSISSAVHHNVVLASAPAAPEITVLGNSLSITDGDFTPIHTDFTHFGGVNAASGTVVHTFTIENTGDATLNLTGSPIVLISGIHPADFTVATQPPTNVGANSSIGFQVIFNPSAVGTRSATLSIANTDADENPYNFTIQGTGYTATEAAVADWASSYPGISGPDADPLATPFNDGIPNVLKYAFNMPLDGPRSNALNPAGGPGANGLPVFTVNPTGPNPTFTAQFLRRKNSGLTYVPKRATSLQNFTPMLAPQVVTSIDADWELVTVAEPLGTPIPSTFFSRVEVALP